MTDLFVIDYGPMEDLMFWNRFARLLKARGADAPPTLILLGSGEKVQGMLGGPGAAPRTGGELSSGPDEDRKLERGMREELQSIVANLTDEGISAVGFCGLDRNLLRYTENVRKGGGTPERRVETGERALASVTKWTGNGVVPVVSCVARSAADGVRDVHPAVVAGSVADALTDARIVLVAQRLTSSLRASVEDPENAMIGFDDAAGSLTEPGVAERLVERYERVHVTHPELGDLLSPPRIEHIG